MAEHDKTIHVDLHMEGPEVDQIDFYKIFSEMSGVEINSMNVKTYFTKKVDKPEKK